MDDCSCPGCAEFYVMRPRISGQVLHSNHTYTPECFILLTRVIPSHDSRTESERSWTCDTKNVASATARFIYHMVTVLLLLSSIIQQWTYYGCSTRYHAPHSCCTVALQKVIFVGTKHIYMHKSRLHAGNQGSSGLTNCRVFVYVAAMREIKYKSWTFKVCLSFQLALETTPRKPRIAKSAQK